MYQTGCNAYKQSAGNTVEDNRVVLIKLYDGALKFLAHARRGILEASPKIRGENIAKAMAIITELDCALDRENGEPIATQLSTLYSHAMDQLTVANLNNDIQAIEHVECILREIMEGFEMALAQQQSKMPQNAAPAEIIQAVEKPPKAPSREGVRFAV